MCRIWLARGHIEVHGRGYTYIYVKGQEGKELVKYGGREAILIVVVRDEGCEDTTDKEKTK